MNSKVTKLAAAAVIILVVILAIRGSSIRITTPAFGLDDVRAAVKQAEWVHCVMRVEHLNVDLETARELGIGGWETWVSLHPPCSIEKHDDGRILYAERDTGKTLRYDPVANVITAAQQIPSTPQDAAMNMIDEWAKSLADIEEHGGEVTYEEGTYEGRPVTIIGVDFAPPDGNPHSVLSVAVDPETRYPLRLTWEQTHSEKGLHGVMTGVFDYPDSGPTNIYEAGAAEDAKIVDVGTSDSELSPKALDVIAQYGTARDRLPERWIFVAVKTDEAKVVRSVDIGYRDSSRERWEYRSTLNPRIQVSVGDVPVSGGVAALRKWAHGLQCTSRYEMLFDGTYRYTAQYEGAIADGKWLVHEKEKMNPAYPFSGGGLDHVGWPRTKGEVVEDATAAQRGFVCIEARDQARVREGRLIEPAQRRVYYLDPNHDYMCVRWETYRHVMPSAQPLPSVVGLEFDPGTIPSSPTRVSEVIGFARLESGHWYPSQVREVSRVSVDQAGQRTLTSRTEVTTIHLEVDPEFPEGVFDLNQFPELTP